MRNRGLKSDWRESIGCPLPPTGQGSGALRAPGLAPVHTIGKFILLLVKMQFRPGSGEDRVN